MRIIAPSKALTTVARRERRQRGSRPRAFSSEINVVADAETFSLVEGSIRAADMRSGQEPPESLAQGTLDPVDEQEEALDRKLRGHYQYYGRSTNFRSLVEFYAGSSDLAEMA